MKHGEHIPAKKSLGQHFLKSEKALQDIIAAGDIHTGETILEIGPGGGVLTRALLDAGARVIAIEKDHRLIAPLRVTFHKEITSGQLKLIEADVLEMSFADYGLLTTDYKLISNIPYYITGAIIRKFLSNIPVQPSRIVLLVQKEVAERIVARNKKESVLSISVRAYGTPYVYTKVPRGAFAPAPKIDSAVLVIENISRNNFNAIDESILFSIVKKAFGSKRKMLLNNFHNAERAVLQTKMETRGLSTKARAEDLSLDDWLALSTSA